MPDMKPLWAPWRMDYIRQPKQGGCFLCDMFRAAADRENLIVRRGPTCAIVMNRFPYNNGHLMVAPYRHFPDLAGLNDGERLELMHLIEKGVEALKAAVRPDGFNIGINLGRVAGAGLDTHLHLHIVPRWNGDTNFMPVLADTKVIPQTLEELRDQLAAALAG